jgi:hypothetical protein
MLITSYCFSILLAGLLIAGVALAINFVVFSKIVAFFERRHGKRKTEFYDRKLRAAKIDYLREMTPENSQWVQSCENNVFNQPEWFADRLFAALKPLNCQPCTTTAAAAAVYFLAPVYLTLPELLASWLFGIGFLVFFSRS